MRVVVDQSVPEGIRDAVRESVAEMLVPILRRHHLFKDLAAVVSHGTAGWNVVILTLDPLLSLSGEPVPGIGTDLLEAIQQALRHTHGA